jgi:hypothetical protein
MAISDGQLDRVTKALHPDPVGVTKMGRVEQLLALDVKRSLV